jgi:hypothetical protein
MNTTTVFAIKYGNYYPYEMLSLHSSRKAAETRLKKMAAEGWGAGYSIVEVALEGLDNMSVELIACPVRDCGAKATTLFISNLHTPEGVFHGWCVECTQCDCRSKYYPTEEDAVRAWNGEG